MWDSEPGIENNGRLQREGGSKTSHHTPGRVWLKKRVSIKTRGSKNLCNLGEELGYFPKDYGNC